MSSTEHTSDRELSRPAAAMDIAVVGMACRFPGARDYDEYWRNIVARKNCIREVPADRWDWRRYYGDPRQEPNKTTVKWGGFIDDIDKFDPLFFGIAPSEAAFIDPQHRLFLETAWHAVEDAGYSIGSLSGKKIGVYAGVSKNDYSELMRESRQDITPYISTGTVHSILVNRVSFLFNLRGRSEAVDTACSSSLVALHNAIRDIAGGECEAAIVGGVNALITPTMFISHTKSGMLSPDGQCKTFSAGANGYVRSEGVGVVFIKTLRQALLDGDHIHAVIKSSAINHGGRANFLTSPTTEAQAAVVKEALRRASIDPRSIDYIEAHGTGTPLGDPIEINGLKRAFAELMPELAQTQGAAPHCALSAVKTNVGHLESASGMAGMIKVIMAMKHRQIPSIRNFDRLNPYIELDDSPFYIATETLPWKNGDHPRRAGISSFGMGGVNAHVVLEEAPARAPDAVATPERCVVPLSARKGRLKAYAEVLLENLKERGAAEAPGLRDVAYTLQSGRDVFEERLAIVATSIEELTGRLEAFVAQGTNDGVYTSDSRAEGEAGPQSGDDPAGLATRWVRGAKVDWAGTAGPGSPRRVPLPTYPFARRRCWFTDVTSKDPVAPEAEADAPRREASGSARTLRPADFFIKDHVVQGNPMLPAVAHLELARAAAAARPGESRHIRRLKDVYWLTPVVVEGRDVEVELALTPQSEGIKFEVRQNQTVHSQGIMADLPGGTVDVRRVDIAAIRSRCRTGLGKAELYPLLREHGLAYGPSFQVIERYVHNDREILAELRLPEEQHADAGQFVLHPSIMDGVFQAITALSLLGNLRQKVQYIPFHLEAAEIVHPTRERCVVYASFSDPSVREVATATFNASLLGEDGHVLVGIKNLQKRPIARRPAPLLEPGAQSTLYYRPVWRERQTENGPSQTAGPLILFAPDKTALEPFARHWPAARIVLVLPGDSHRRLEENVHQIDPRESAGYVRLLQQLHAEGVLPSHVVHAWSFGTGVVRDPREAIEASVSSVLRFTQAAFQVRSRENVRLVYAYGTQEPAPSIHSMVAGFARTLSYENPKFGYLTLGLDSVSMEDVAAAACKELRAVPSTNPMREVLYREGRRHERGVVAEDAPDRRPDVEAASLIRRGGVYLLSGGAGGLGSVLSRYLAEKYGATLLWLGRSARTPAIDERIARIEQAGGRCEYYSADIADRDALARVLSQIKSVHGQIHGVIHAAAVIDDAFILRKQHESFARVVEPKVLGAIHLDELTQSEALDFFLVFSSIAALMPNQGQCDYAAANSFLDSFAEARNHAAAAGLRSGVSLSLNWPLWAEGGIRVTEAEERHLAKAFGMKPLATAEGLKIFERSLALAVERTPELHQLMAIGGDREKIEKCLGVETLALAAMRPAGPEASGPHFTKDIKSIFAGRLGVRPESIDGARTIGELGVDSSSLIGVIQDINEHFDANLKPTLLFDINTVDKLSAYLQNVGKGKKAAAVPRGHDVPRWNRSLIDVQESDPAGRLFRRTFRTSEFYLRDHVVDGQFNMPGACYVEMARQAGELAFGQHSVKRLLHNYWARPLSSPVEDFTAHVQITSKQNHYAYEIFSIGAGGERHLHAMGQIGQDDFPKQGETVIDAAAVIARCDETQNPRRVYEQIHGEGLHVGPTFQPMKEIFLNDEEALGVFELPDEIRSTSEDYVLHPALLTGAFQTALISNRRNAGNNRRYIPIGMDELEVLAPIPAECLVYCRPRAGNARNDEMRKFDLDICRPDGGVVVRLGGFSIRALKEVTVPAEPRVQAPVEAPRASARNAILSAVRELIKNKLAGPIGLDAVEIDEAVEFDRYGVTSIMVVELNQTFEDLLGPIPKTLFFEYRNINELAEYFVENHGEVLQRLLGETSQPAPPAVVSPAPAPVAVREDEAGEVHAFLRALIARPIGLPAEEIDDRTGFDQYGVNSVMVVELNELFERIFGPLSKTLFFEYRSIEELADYFRENHREALLAALPPQQEARNEPDGESQQVNRDAAEVPVGVSEERRVASSGVQDLQGIAIVSAAGRFPGARNLAEFWDVLKEGRDCITEIPPGRFNYGRYYDEDPARNGIYGKWGGFMDDVDRFDPSFFNISPREAELIDPQERLLLEVVWEMLEHAGYTRQRLQQRSEGRVGVFVGALWQPYESAGVEETVAGNPIGPSSLLYSIANRISYFLDLTGPSMAIDTACSSSMTALHLACQSIRSGESRSAIVAGVNLSLTVSKYLFLSRYRFLSTDGRCRSYGAGGDGYVPGEGVCALMLKPLADAIADSDTILAVIKGSALNHGGRTNGYTVPNPKAQGNVIAQALEQSGVDPRTISYIEGHGTGTSLGDPIEIAGLEKALKLSRDGESFCAIGSVKSNIGHLEAAAGVASVIKVLLQMQHGQLAPSLHSEQLNPNIDFVKSPFRVQRELAEWTRRELVTGGKKVRVRRIAGISSFGAGGSNAHVILEEYDGPAAPVVRTNGPALCVFSARTEERLIALVEQFASFLRDPSTGDPHPTAHTLQLGREAMRERFAVVAGTIAELREALADFLAKRPLPQTSVRGRAVTGRGAAGLERPAPETIEQWRKSGDLVRIAQAWVQGAEIDWSAFYGGRDHRFLPLPTYPFAKERYWIDGQPVAPIAASVTLPASAKARLHPLLHRNASDLSGQRFVSTFTGEEFFLEDHQVYTDAQTVLRVLPGVAYLEMARAAIEQAVPSPPEASVLELRNVVWTQPIVVTANKDVSIAISTANDGSIDYRIYSGDGASELVHCQGRAAWSREAAPSALDLERLADEMAHATLEQKVVYGSFGRKGLVLGPSFQPINEIHLGDRQLLSYLRLPHSVQRRSEEFVLHPSMMDGALQGSLGLIDGWFEGSGRPRMPFALESLRVFAPCTQEMVAWMRHAPGSEPDDQVVKLDVDLCDARGRVCVRMRGFASRVLKAPSPEAVGMGKAVDAEPVTKSALVTLAPAWEALKPEAGAIRPASGERVVVIGGDEALLHGLWEQCGAAEVVKVDGRATVEQLADKLRGDSRIDHIVWILPAAKERSEPSDSFIEDQEEGVLLGFRLIKALLREGYGAAELGWTVVTTATQRVGGRRDEIVDATHGSVAGLLGSLAKEHSNWKLRLVDVGRGALPWGELLRLGSDARGDGWAHRDGQWYRRSLVPCDLGESSGTASGYRRGGVYVVIGGAGGVGEVWSESLIRDYDARIVWIGRRPKDSAIERKLERLAARGVAPLYVAADARNREELEQAYQEIQRHHGQIHGVVHSAIVLSDKSVANMDEDQFRAALSTKVDVAVRVAQVFGREPLDFILYFSSLQSDLKAPGQSNYAAGCTFTDAFAEWQAATAGYSVKVMNWGYWGNIGIVAGTEYQERMARMGWGSIAPEEGMAGLERLLRGPLDRAGMLSTHGTEALRVLGVEAGETIRAALAQVPPVTARLSASVEAEAADELRTWETQRRELDRVLAGMLRALLFSMASPGNAPEGWSEEDWKTKTGIAGDYDRWLHESLRIVHGRDDLAEADGQALWSEWEREKFRWAEQGAGISAHVQLVEATLRSLPAILRGEKRATDVMFPGSSLGLVEGVYKNNHVSDYFNEAMADVVCRYVEERRREAGPRPEGLSLRLLELGAGTGGSTQTILRRLDAYRQEVAEYRYTDVSKVFLVHGEQAYGASRDYLQYAVLDVERGLEEQGMEHGAYDVVLAANVLHATKRLRETLRNAKAALKQNGILILNEISEKSVFHHLTFGLLSGWWAYEDDPLRMDGNPGLTPDSWKRVLEEEGFRHVFAPARQAHGLGQQVIVAESDGVIRQRIATSSKKRIAVTPAPVIEAPVPAPPTPEVRAVSVQGAELHAKVESWVVDAIGVLLKVKREDVDPDAELSELGFDSISLTGLANHVNRGQALELMPTIFFEHPTVRAFSRFLVERHGEKLARAFSVDTHEASVTAAVTTAAAPRPTPAGAELQMKIESFVVDAIGAVLKVRREDVDLDAELSELGFDSISLTGLANHVNRAQGLELMPTIFFEHPTVRAFSRHLVEKHGERLAPSFMTPASAVPPATPVADVPRRTQESRPVIAANDTPAEAEPIAIIGMSGRLPGAEDLEQFWENLKAGRESIVEVPRERWDWRALDGAQSENGSPSGVKWGAFIDGVDEFDPLFFGISPREAELIDPQHRLTMMYGWKAFEDAGYGPKQLWGSRTGIFIGTANTGYGELLLTQAGTGIEGYTATGLVPSVGPNRLSYLLNLHGPSEPIETACSSSLVAVHRAVRAIAAGDCEMALVGGVNTLFPTLHISFNKAGMLSPDGKCKTFSSRADGYARGEGVGMAVLKKLSAAERDGDHIYAVIRGSAENHGGRAQSLTAPNPQAQAELIKDAYRRAGVSPRSLSYIEAHGTGTPLGDPVEINGLKSAFEGLYAETGEAVQTGYCGLGSVKTNIGHLELAAGIAGLLKILLQLKHKTLVGVLHCEEVNPYIRLEDSPFYIVRENQPWARLADEQGGEWPRRAGVSSFGFGGVNAHVLIEEYEGGAAKRVRDAGPTRDGAMIVLSARTADRLKAQAAQLRQWLARREGSDDDLNGLAYTLQVGREAMDHRVAMTAASMSELEAKLDAFLEEKSAIEGLYRGEVTRNNETLAVFRGDEELREAVAKWLARGKWSKVLELWVKGLEIEWEQMYGEVKPGRLSLPTYPFARERCWIDASASGRVAVKSASAAVLHPLLHHNTSDLSEQCYRSTFTGEEFFLTDHQVLAGSQVQKVLPGAAYLEMARAAITQASPGRESSILELRDTIWLKPVIVGEAQQVVINLSAEDDGSILYEIHSGEGSQESVHCQGRGLFVRSASVAQRDVARLLSEMTRGRMETSELYAMLTGMGLHYGPAHQGVTAIDFGDGQLLAHLRLPSGVLQSRHDYVLHPSVMDSALQASLGLIIDMRHPPGKPSVPFALDSIRILSACTEEMVAWVRHSAERAPGDKTIKVNIDLCDQQGNVCVEMRGLTSRVLDNVKPAAGSHRIPIAASRAGFDDAFYQSLIADVVNRTVSADEAAELE